VKIAYSIEPLHALAVKNVLTVASISIGLENVRTFISIMFFRGLRGEEQWFRHVRIVTLVKVAKDSRNG